MNSRFVATCALALFVLSSPRAALAVGVRKVLVETGARGLRTNIVILAEGYTRGEEAKFDRDASNVLTTMLRDPFYADYRAFFNGYSIFVASNQSGADHPAAGKYVSTYFNSTFGSFGVDRLLTIPPNDVDPDYNHGEGKIVDLLSNLLPDYNVVLLLVNDSTYGGSGGSFAITSTNPSSTEIAIHELGHSLVHLGDEYSDPLPGYPDTEEPNTTMQTILSLVKWRAWIAPETPLPTPPTQQFATVVGLFQGAHYHSDGWYRPQLDCKMNHLGIPFCRVCLEASALTFYGITPPIESFSPTTASVNLTANQSQSFVLAVKQPTVPLSIQWALDGQTLGNQPGSTFTLNANDLGPGRHHVCVLVQDVSDRIRTDANKLAQETKNWTVDVNGPVSLPQPLNVSTRLYVQTGDKVMIGGFIITGTEPKKVLIRALGPSLSANGLTDVLADPVLELHGPGGLLIMSNDDWKENLDQATQIQASGVPPGNDRESAIAANLSPGSYTAIVRGKNGTAGAGLLEAYDLEQAADARLANISTRGFVQGEDKVMIAGFIVGGANGSSTVVVRALGPSLSASGVAEALQNPTLELHNGSGTLLAANDNWKETQQVSIEAMGLAPPNDLESAMIATLPVGAYTAVVAGKGESIGNALVEVYDVR